MAKYKITPKECSTCAKAGRVLPEGRKVLGANGPVTGPAVQCTLPTREHKSVIWRIPTDRCTEWSKKR